ncbi:MAG: ECF transporter S component [Peptococcaceae bacterium]|nr:ECF transporter S component [Peptococcaceae bacterium]
MNKSVKQTNKQSKKLTTRTIAVSGVLGAITIMLSVTGLGMIPMPSLAGRATIMHVPVILGAILEGPVVGAFTGFIFGLYSFMTPVGAIPADPIVRILPRILIGITAYYTYVLCRRSAFGAVMAAIVGTLTNTIGYLGLATLIGYLPWAASLTVMVTQMPFELVLASVLILALYKAFHRKAAPVFDDESGDEQEETIC